MQDADELCPFPYDVIVAEHLPESVEQTAQLAAAAGKGDQSAVEIMRHLPMSHDVVQGVIL